MALSDTIAISANISEIKNKIKDVIGDSDLASSGNLSLKALKNQITAINTTLKNINRSSLQTFNKLLTKAASTSAIIARNLKGFETLKNLDLRKLDKNWVNAQTTLMTQQAKKIQTEREINAMIPLEDRITAQSAVLRKKSAQTTILEAKANMADKIVALETDLKRLQLSQGSFKLGIEQETREYTITRQKLLMEREIFRLQQQKNKTASDAQLNQLKIEAQERKNITSETYAQLRNQRAQMAQQIQATTLETKEFKLAQAKTRELEKQKRHLANQKGLMKQLTGYAIRYLAYFSLRATASAAFNTRMEYERGATVFANLLPTYGYGDFTEASLERRLLLGKEMMRDYIDFAKQMKINPYTNLLDVSQFVGTRVGGISLTEQMNRAKTITKLATMYHMDTVHTQMLFKNFRDFAAKGTISSRDLNEIAGTGLNLRQTMADLYGITMPEFTKRLQLGAIDAKKTLQMLFDYYDKTLNNIAVPNNLLTSLEDVKSAIREVLLVFTEGTSGEVLKTFLWTLTGVLKILKPFIPLLTTLATVWTVIYSVNKTVQITKTITALYKETTAVHSLIGAYTKLGVSKYTAYRSVQDMDMRAIMTSLGSKVLGWGSLGLMTAGAGAHFLGWNNVASGLAAAGSVLGGAGFLKMALPLVLGSLKLGKLVPLLLNPYTFGATLLAAGGYGIYRYHQGVKQERQTNQALREQETQNLNITIQNKSGFGLSIGGDYRDNSSNGVKVNLLGVQY